MKNVLVFFFALLIMTPNLHANLEDFQDRVEQAEARGGADQDYDDDDVDDGEGEESLFGELMWALLRVVWVGTNAYTTFGPHPYAEGNFVRLPRWGYNESVAGKRPEPRAFLQEGRNGFGSLQTEAFLMRELGGGVWGTYRSYWWRFLGPYVEGWTMTDGMDNYLNGIRAGLEFSLLQTNPFNLSLYAQWQGWTGLFSRSGAVFGVHVLSYPLNPLVLEARAGVQAFPFFSLSEAEASLGVMLGAWEVYGGWRWWTIDGEPFGRYPEYNGWRLGARLWI